MFLMQFATRAFVPALVSFLVGVGLAAFVFSSLAFGTFFILLAFALFVLGMARKNRAHFFLFAACTLFLALGIFRFTFWGDALNDQKLESQIGQTVILRGLIADEPDVREKNTQLRFAMKEIIDGEMKVPVRGIGLLIVDRYPEYHYGDAVEIRGAIKHPEAFAGDDGRIFDYPNYLKAKGMSYQFFYPKTILRDSEQGNPVRATLFSVKHAFLERLALVLPEPENALAGGILLGGKRSLGDEWTQRFRDVGIIHIIVLSGYNMTIVAEWLGAAFLFFGVLRELNYFRVGNTLFCTHDGCRCDCRSRRDHGDTCSSRKTHGKNLHHGAGTLGRGSTDGPPQPFYSRI